MYSDIINKIQFTEVQIDAQKFLLTCSEISGCWLLKVTLTEQPFRYKYLSLFLFLCIFSP